MAVFAPSDLKKLRIAHNMSAADLAELVTADSSTITRYENGKLKPNPDVMYQILEELDALDSWCDWMRTEYPISYGRIHPEIPKLSFEGKLLKAFAEINDVQLLQNQVMKDGSDGFIDDDELRAHLLRECHEAIGALQGVVNALSCKGGKRNG